MYYSRSSSSVAPAGPDGRARRACCRKAVVRRDPAGGRRGGGWSVTAGALSDCPAEQRSGESCGRDGLWPGIARITSVNAASRPIGARLQTGRQRAGVACRRSGHGSVDGAARSQPGRATARRPRLAKRERGAGDWCHWRVVRRDARRWSLDRSRRRAGLAGLGARTVGRRCSGASGEETMRDDQLRASGCEQRMRSSSEYRAARGV